MCEIIESFVLTLLFFLFKNGMSSDHLLHLNVLNLLSRLNLLSLHVMVHVSLQLHLWWDSSAVVGLSRLDIDGNNVTDTVPDPVYVGAGQFCDQSGSASSNTPYFAV